MTSEFTNIINGLDWLVIGKPSCPWCERAKYKLNKLNVHYKYWDVSAMPDLKEWMMENGLRTVPQVFRKGSRIGGYEQLVEYLKGITGV